VLFDAAKFQLQGYSTGKKKIGNYARQLTQVISSPSMQLVNHLKTCQRISCLACGDELEVSCWVRAAFGMTTERGVDRRVNRQQTSDPLVPVCIWAMESALDVVIVGSVPGLDETSAEGMPGIAT